MYGQTVPLALGSTPASTSFASQLQGLKSQLAQEQRKLKRLKRAQRAARRYRTKKRLGAQISDLRRRIQALKAQVSRMEGRVSSSSRGGPIDPDWRHGGSFMSSQMATRGGYSRRPGGVLPPWFRRRPGAHGGSYAPAGRVAFEAKMAALAEQHRMDAHFEDWAPGEQDDYAGLAMELGALEMELAGLEQRAAYGGCRCGGGAYGGCGCGGSYGDLGADGRGTTAAIGTGAGAAGTAAGLTYVGGGSLAAGAGFAAGAGAAGAATAAVVLAPVAVAAAAVAVPAAVLATWRADARNIARLQKKIKRLRATLKSKLANARSKPHKMRLKRRYLRRIQRAKRRLDRIRRVLRRRIQRAKKRGNADKVKRLRGMKNAALYGRGRKAAKKRRKRRLSRAEKAKLKKMQASGATSGQIREEYDAMMSADMFEGGEIDPLHRFVAGGAGAEMLATRDDAVPLAEQFDVDAPIPGYFDTDLSEEYGGLQGLTQKSWFPWAVVGVVGAGVWWASRRKS